MRFAIPLLILPFALAACDVHTSDADKNDNDNVHISVDGKGLGDKVSVNVPGFNASVSLPSLNLGEKMDIDGVKLAPDSKIATMDVQGHNSDKHDDSGVVRMGFSNPGAPAKIVGYYKDALSGAGYSVSAVSDGGLTATKGNKNFGLSVSPDGSGSKGTITITGSD